MTQKYALPTPSHQLHPEKRNEDGGREMKEVPGVLTVVYRVSGADILIWEQPVMYTVPHVGSRVGSGTSLW